MTYVDERVVEMRFDNKQFEQETAKTMSTLDKLKEKLQFKNASSGAEQLQKAVNSININPVIQGIDTIETKMSTLGIAGKRVIENLTDWAMSGIHKVINKLNPIPQIITGGKSRAQNIEQAKFQLEGLGVAWSDIQEDINYGVQDTAYGLDAAAKVASQLVASQVELGDEMKHALLGISGVAAMTNSSYEDIGRIYTTVAGNGRLMGEQLLQLSSRGINAAAQLAKAFNTTEADIRDMVSKGKISFEMFSDAMFEAFGEHAKSANKTFQGALSNTKAALSRLGADVAAQGFDSIRDILNEVIPKLKDFKKAIEPVETSIKNLIDTIGKLIEKLVKAIDINKIVDKIVPKIKSFVDEAAEWVKAYEQIFTGKSKAAKGGTAYYYEQRALQGITDEANKSTEAIIKLNEITEDQKRIANEIWYEGLHGTGEARKEELGKDYEAVQTYIEEMIKLGWDEAKMQEKVAKSAEEEQKELENLAKTEKKRAFLEKLNASLSNLKTVVKNVATSIKNVLTVAFDAFGKSFGKNDTVGGIVGFTASLAGLSEKFKITKDKAEKLRPIFDGLYKVFKTLGKIVVTVAKGFKTVITIAIDIIKTINNSGLFKTVKSKLGGTLTVVKNTIFGIIDAVKNTGLAKTVKTTGENLVKSGTNFIVDFTKGLAGGILNFAKVLGTIITTIVKYFSGGLTKVIDIVSEPIGELLKLITGVITAIDPLNAIQFGGVIVFFKIIFTFLRFFNNTAKMAESVSKIPLSISKFFENCAKVPKSISGFFDSLSGVAKAKSKELRAESFKMIIDSIVNVIKAIILLTVVMSAIPNADKLAWQAAAIVGIITALFGAISIITEKIEQGGKTTKGAKGFNLTIHTQKAQLGLMFAGVGVLMLAIVKGISTLYSILTSSNYDPTAAAQSISIVLGITALLAAMVLAIAYGMSKVKAADNYNWRKTNLLQIATLLIAFALSIKLVVSAINTIYDMVKQSSNMNKFTAIIGFVVALYGIVIVLVYMLNKFNKKVKGMLGLSITLLAFAGSLKIIASAIEDIMGVANKIEDSTKFSKVMGYLITMLILLGSIALIGAGVISNAKSFKSSALLGLSLMFISLSMVLKSIGTVFDVMSSAYKSTGERSFEAALNALVDVIFMLSLSVAVITALNRDAKNVGSLVGLAALFLSLSVTLSTISKSIAKLAEFDVGDVMDISAILIGFVSILSAIMLGLAMAMNGMKGTTLTMLGISAAVLALSISIAILGNTFKTIFKEIGVGNFESLALAMGIFVGAVIALVVAMTLLTGPLGAASLLGLAAVFIGIGVGLFFAGKGVNYLLDAFERLVGYLVTAGDFIVSVFSSLKSAISNLFSPIDKKETDLGKIYGDGSSTEQNLADKWNISSDFLTTTEKKSLGREAEEKAVAAADYQYITYKATYYEELNKQAKENPTYFKPSVSDEEVAENKKVVEDTAKQIATNDAETTYENYTETLSKELDKLEETDTTSFWDPSSLYEGVDSINVGEGLGFDFSELQSKFSTGVENTDFSGELTSSLYDMFGEDGDLANLMSEGGIEGGDDYISSMIGTLTDGSGDIMSAVGFTMDDVKTAINSKNSEVQDAAKVVPETALNTAKSYENEFYRAGVLLYEGFAEGLSDKEPKELAENNMADVVWNMKRALEKTAEIKSPSRLFARIGKFVTLGFAEGISSLSYAAEEATEDVGEDSVSALRSILDRIFDTTMAGLDTNPVITPVLDLSELQNGLYSMNGMLDNNSSFGLAFGAANGYNRTLAIRNAAMNVDTEYDGTNVVEAIDGLRTDLANMQASLNTLGFYVDGKQMATAIANPMNKALTDISVRVGRGVE